MNIRFLAPAQAELLRQSLTKQKSPPSLAHALNKQRQKPYAQLPLTQNAALRDQAIHVAGWWRASRLVLSTEKASAKYLLSQSHIKEKNLSFGRAASNAAAQ